MKWNTRVTEMLRIKYPVVQGGLAYLAYSDLAAAVSNAGGLGQITAMSMSSAEALRNEIKRVKTLTSKPFGVNYAIGQHGRPYEDMLEVAIDEKVPVISVTGGNPAPVFQKLEGTEIKKLVLVSGTRQAVKAEQLGADAVMAVGQEGGGHLGKHDIGTMVLIPQVVDAVDIPVLASGGIGDGRSLMAGFALGAEGVEMGTRFIATQECIHAHNTYKERIISSKETDTVVIKRAIQAPARALKNEWTDKILKVEDSDPSYEALKDFISGEANKRYIYEGKEQEGFGWAGQVVGRINDIPTVKELFDRIFSEAAEVRKRWGNTNFEVKS
ncbi:NAD(P)H-dependent flavin oxidoreductase [Pseudalkalibacillus caeni]|uniref:Probable nitronate monooxygenase n=1 Tax=Exobacillus caeni TaxID=2574798 RepID=A0A5R9F7S7_9BACL|nr:nitronate monooxygenase family protein [Pseudalkalibacillus caeni]TLS37688.1 nitronate monooxygenase [Pseudalkalibacillus caeni]